MSCCVPRGVLNAAIQSARRSEHYFKIGAVIFKGKRIYSTRCNSVRNSPRIKDKYKKHPYSLHAEQAAILDAKNDISGCSILVVRLSASGQYLVMSKPCDICTSFIIHVRLKSIFFSNGMGLIERVRVRDL